MKIKYNFLFISTADWDNPFWTNKQHMAKILSEQGHKVLYFESLGLRAPSSKSSSDKKRIFKRIAKFFKGLKIVNQNLAIFSPLIIPKHNNPLIAFLNKLLLMLYIYIFKIVYFQGQSIICWTYNPLSLEFLKGEKLIYHCVDDLTAAPGLPAEKIKEFEQTLINHSLITFVTSPTLKTKFSNFGDKVHYFPNVADVELFETALQNLQKPLDLNNLEGPIIGFIGAISSYKVDFHLLKYVAESFPHANIILIGQVGEGDPHTKIDTIQNIPNIHLLGPKDYNLLPSYLRYFDVAILPCCINDYTRSMFPMKFFEYLAAEKKVVSTNLPSISDFSDCCFVAKNYDEFVLGIAKALNVSLKDFCDYQKLKSSVKENTWKARSEKMLKLLNQLI